MKILKIVFIQIGLLLLSVIAWAQSPDWSVNASDYEFSMSFTGVVVYGGVEADNPDDQLSAWSGTELRGVAHPVYVESKGKYYFLLMVYSNTVNVSEEISFQYYNASENSTHTLLNQEVFVLDKNQGSFTQPYIFSEVETTTSEERTSFLSFDLEELEETVSVNESTQTLTLELSSEQDVSGLAAVFELPENSTVKVDRVVQISGSTQNDFSDTVFYTITDEYGYSRTWSVVVESNSESEEEETEEEEEKPINGLSEAELAQTVSVFPNPFHHTVSFKSEYDIEEVQVFSIDGKLLNVYQEIASINLSEFPSGMYVFYVYTSVGKIPFKTIKY